MKILTPFLLLVFAITANAQSPQQNLANSLGVGWGNVTIYPEFKGGEGAMMAFIKKNIKNPTAAGVDDITVVCKATIDTAGLVQKVAVSRIMGGSTNKQLYIDEAIRVIKLMPPWLPATSKGKKIVMDAVVSINFKGYLK